MRVIGIAEDDKLAAVMVIGSPKLTMVAHSGRREQDLGQGFAESFRQTRSQGKMLPVKGKGVGRSEAQIRVLGGSVTSDLSDSANRLLTL